MRKKLAVTTILLMLAALAVVECRVFTLSGVYALNGGTTIITNQTYMSNTTDVSNLTDLNRDGKVNILDITIAAKAFGSKPEDSNWNPTADLNKDGVVDGLDIALVAEDQGKAVDNKATQVASPAFEEITANATIAGRPVQLTCAVNSDINVSSYIYSWNNTGTWRNQTAVSFSDFINSTEANAIFLGTWNSTGGDTVSVIVYTNDTGNNWAESTQYNFTLVILPSSVAVSQNWAGYVSARAPMGNSSTYTTG